MVVKECECCRENFLFSNAYAWQLYAPQYRGSRGWSIFYLVWRIFTALYFLASIIYIAQLNCCEEGKLGIKWLLYLTNQTFVLFCLQHLWSAGVTCYMYYRKGIPSCGEREEEEGEQLTWYLKMNWIGSEMSSPLVLTITVMFWTLIYHDGEEVIYQTVVTHGINALWPILFDVWITAMPIKVLHLYAPVSFAIWYVVFAIIYDFAGGIDGFGNPYIYQIMDWSEDMVWPTIYALICLVVITVLHSTLFGLYKLRLFLHHHVCHPSTNRVTAEPDAELATKSYQTQRNTHDDCDLL